MGLPFHTMNYQGFDGQMGLSFSSCRRWLQREVCFVDRLLDKSAALARMFRILMFLSGSIALLLIASPVLGFSWRLSAVAVPAMLAVTIYYIVVFWNPLLGELQRDHIGGSSAWRLCRYQADKEPEWSAIASSVDHIKSGHYYREYHGHLMAHIVQVHRTLQQHGCGSFIYLCGDSSLDNKHWFFSGFLDKEHQMGNRSFTSPAVNGYEHVLADPPHMVKDVCFHLNDIAAQRVGSCELCAINTSVEASTLADRDKDGLLIQDAFIRDHVTNDDFIIVSIGGNDIALSPTLRTAVNMAMLTRCPNFLIRMGLAPGLGYFVKFFHGGIQKFLCRLVAKKKPKKILVCMIYYPDVVSGGSWADYMLRLLGYDSNPDKLQLIIRTVFERIKSMGFRDAGTIVEPFPLFEVLSNHSDYLQRVEPSISGGRKMAAAFLESLL